MTASKIVTLLVYPCGVDAYRRLAEHGRTHALARVRTTPRNVYVGMMAVPLGGVVRVPVAGLEEVVRGLGNDLPIVHALLDVMPYDGLSKHLSWRNLPRRRTEVRQAQCGEHATAIVTTWAFARSMIIGVLTHPAQHALFPVEKPRPQEP
jgi:hypothetical protein